ncbi:MAG: hypothetical protein AB7F31_04075 [Parachlamydiales bacterium]
MDRAIAYHERAPLPRPPHWGERVVIGGSAFVAALIINKLGVRLPYALTDAVRLNNRMVSVLGLTGALLGALYLATPPSTPPVFPEEPLKTGDPVGNMPLGDLSVLSADLLKERLETDYSEEDLIRLSQCCRGLRNAVCALNWHKLLARFYPYCPQPKGVNSYILGTLQRVAFAGAAKGKWTWGEVAVPRKFRLEHGCFAATHWQGRPALLTASLAPYLMQGGQPASVWDLHTGEELKSWPAQGGGRRLISCFPLITFCENGTLYSIDPATGQESSCNTSQSVSLTSGDLGLRQHQGAWYALTRFWPDFAPLLNTQTGEVSHLFPQKSQPCWVDLEDGTGVAYYNGAQSIEIVSLQDPTRPLYTLSGYPQCPSLLKSCGPHLYIHAKGQPSNEKVLVVVDTKELTEQKIPFSGNAVRYDQATPLRFGNREGLLLFDSHNRDWNACQTNKGLLLEDDTLRFWDLKTRQTTTWPIPKSVPSKATFFGPVFSLLSNGYPSLVIQSTVMNDDYNALHHLTFDQKLPSLFQ